MPSPTVAAASAGESSPTIEPVPARRVRARAPLRLGLAGGGTDVSPYCDTYGGVVLNATIDRYCYATVEPSPAGTAEFVASDVGIVDAGDGARHDGSHGRLDLHRAVYHRLVSDYGLGRPAVRLTTMSDAPPGSGLGSSSTLVVAAVEAFREYFSLPLARYDVARLAVQIERLDCGLKGGRQDQYAATFGGFNLMEFGPGGHAAVHPIAMDDAVVRELEASIVLFHTGVSRSSEAIIEDQTARIAAGQQDAIAATHALKDEAVAMKQALLDGDFGRLGWVLRRGWAAKKRLAGAISNGQIENVLDVAREAGALAGKVSGAGGGGYVLFLADPARRHEVISALESLGEGSVHPVHFVFEGAVAWQVP